MQRVSSREHISDPKDALAIDPTDGKDSFNSGPKWRRVYKTDKGPSVSLKKFDENDPSAANMPIGENALSSASENQLANAKTVPDHPLSVQPLGERNLNPCSTPRPPSFSSHYSSWGSSPSEKASQASPCDIKADKYETPEETARLRDLVSGRLLKGTIGDRSGGCGTRARPLLTSDITKSGQDVVHVKNIPSGMTIAKVRTMFEVYGKIVSLMWASKGSKDGNSVKIIYEDQASAQEAVHSMHNATMGSNAKPLHVELRCKEQNSNAQVFVGDLTSDITENMLEEFFTKLVGSPVKASLKRDAETGSTIGYGFLTCTSELAATNAVIFGHRAKIGNTSIRVGRAERNTYLYIPELANDVSMDDVWNLFGQYGELVAEDTMLIQRSYAFVRYARREDAERAKRALDKTQLKGRIVVRYAEAEHLRQTIAVQFHVARAPNNLNDLVHSCFGKYGSCSVEIPKLKNGHWRKLAFVTFDGEEDASYLAAAEAVRHVKFVSDIPVMVQFARELIPRMPANVSTNKSSRKNQGLNSRNSNSSRYGNAPSESTLDVASHQVMSQHQQPQVRDDDQWVPILSYVPKHVLSSAYTQMNTNGAIAPPAHDTTYYGGGHYHPYGPGTHGYPQNEWNGLVYPQTHMWYPNLYMSGSRTTGLNDK